jgi:hypothetical protein
MHEVRDLRIWRCGAVFLGIALGISIAGCGSSSREAVEDKLTCPLEVDIDNCMQFVLSECTDSCFVVDEEDEAEGDRPTQVYYIGCGSRGICDVAYDSDGCISGFDPVKPDELTSGDEDLAAPFFETLLHPVGDAEEAYRQNLASFICTEAAGTIDVTQALNKLEFEDCRHILDAGNVRSNGTVDFDGNLFRNLDFAYTTEPTNGDDKVGFYLTGEYDVVEDEFSGVVEVWGGRFDLACPASAFQSNVGDERRMSACEFEDNEIVNSCGF